MRGKGCVSDSFSRLSEGNEETARYKRRNSRPKGRIRFRKAPLEPTNSLTDAIVQELRSSVSIQTTKSAVESSDFLSQFQFDDCKSLVV
jgi:hypothetical protein